MDTLHTPIWLEMRPEFIDQNFNKIVDYLANPSTPKDNFYYETMALFEKRISNQFEDILSTPIYKDDIADDIERKQLRTEKIDTIRLLLAFLLSTPENHSMRRSVLLTILSLLAQIEPTYAHPLVQLACRLLSYDIPYLIRPSWSDIRNFQPQPFIHKILHTTQNNILQTKTTIYSQKGILKIEKGHISLAVNKKVFDQYRISQTAATISVVDDMLRFYVEKERKIKTSDLQDFEKVESMMQDITSVQEKCVVPVLKKYQDGDIVKVVVVSVENNQMRVRTYDSAYQVLEGMVDFDYHTHKNTMTYDYHVEDFCQAYIPGDIIDAQIDSVSEGIFSLFEPLEECHIYDSSVGSPFYEGKIFRAYAAGVWTDSRTLIERIRWISENGLIVQTFQDREHPIAEGTYSNLQIKEITDPYINARIIDRDGEPFDIIQAKREFLINYSPEHDEHLLDKPTTLDKVDIRLLASTLLAYQRQVSEVQERMLLLCFVRFLCTLIGHNTDASYIRFVQDYLKNLVFFARGNTISSPTIDEQLADLELVSTRLQILGILRLCGAEDTENYLQQVQDETTNPLLLKLARLSQAYNNLQSVASEQVLSFIRREIISSLAISTEENADLEESHGDVLGAESSSVEFKTSFVYPPDNNMQPAPDIQMRNIMRGLCAFLNTKHGGTLYIGVNDGGKIVGITDDMRYLHKQTIDSYIRYIQDSIKPFFPNAYSNFDISEMYDNQVIAITVTPYKYGVANIEGIAYRRWGRENRPMNNIETEQLLNERLSYDKHKMRTILDLTTSIEQKRQVILHGYSSSNSLTTRDRMVEAFALTNDNQSVWCYEPEADSVKMFTLSRIGNVEVTNTPWQNTMKHKQGEQDIFHMTGTTPFHVMLQLDTMAYNLLIEEYPLSKPYIKEGDKRAKTPHWILSAKVFSVFGVGRFCIGLMPHITILDGDPLLQFIRDYTQQWLQPIH